MRHSQVNTVIFYSLLEFESIHNFCFTHTVALLKSENSLLYSCSQASYIYELNTKWNLTTPYLFFEIILNLDFQNWRNPIVFISDTFLKHRISKCCIHTYLCMCIGMCVYSNIYN